VLLCNVEHERNVEKELNDHQDLSNDCEPRKTFGLDLQAPKDLQVLHFDVVNKVVTEVFDENVTNHED
jgi:hypothetical protein